jgi:hypothetical protein
MNTRGKVQLLSGAILDYFSQNNSPLWTEIQPDFIKFNITKLTGMEKLSEDFLKSIFRNSPDIQDKLEFFKDHHHYITILLLKDEYSLESCADCGHLSRKIPIDMEEINKKINSNWTLNY